MSSEFPWLNHYPSDVAKTIGSLEHQSLPELFEAASARYADRVAYENMGVKLTFREVDRMSTAFAAWLQSVLRLHENTNAPPRTPFGRTPCAPRRATMAAPTDYQTQAPAERRARFGEHN